MWGCGGQRRHRLRSLDVPCGEPGSRHELFRKSDVVVVDVLDESPFESARILPSRRVFTSKRTQWPTRLGDHSRFGQHGCTAQKRWLRILPQGSPSRLGCPPVGRNESTAGRGGVEHGLVSMKLHCFVATARPSMSRAQRRCAVPSMKKPTHLRGRKSPQRKR